MSGRHLQVFTSVGEWVVTGDPLTPTNIQVQQQSRIGSPRDRQVPPRDVDGATLFVARSGREIREFLFVDTEQAYQAADLALLARHLVRDPVDQAFDHRRRLFLIVDGGRLARHHRDLSQRRHRRLEPAGDRRPCAFRGGRRRPDHASGRPLDGVSIERLDDQLMVDAGVRLSQSAAGLVWTGLRSPRGPDGGGDRG